MNAAVQINLMRPRLHVVEIDCAPEAVTNRGAVEPVKFVTKSSKLPADDKSLKHTVKRSQLRFVDDDSFEPTDEHYRRLTKLLDLFKEYFPHRNNPEFWDLVDKAYEAANGLGDGKMVNRRRVVALTNEMIELWREPYGPNSSVEYVANEWLIRLSEYSAALAEADGRFATIEIETLRELIEHSKPGGKGGAGKRSARGISAKLAVKCNAFDDRGNADDRALDNSTEAFRKSTQTK